MTVMVKIGKKLYEVRDISQAVQKLMEWSMLEEYHQHGEGD